MLSVVNNDEAGAEGRCISGLCVILSRPGDERHRIGPRPATPVARQACA